MMRATRGRMVAIALLALAGCDAGGSVSPAAHGVADMHSGPHVFTAAPLPGGYVGAVAGDPNRHLPNASNRGDATSSLGSPSVGLPQKTSYGQSYYSPADGH